MNQKLGMDTGIARARRDAMQRQISALTVIANDLSTTYTAARNPQAYGIEPGEKSIAPWSMAALNSARIQLQGAESAASGLLQRIAGEANAQDAASGNDDFWAVPLAAYAGYQEFSGWRSWLSRPRTLLELPSAVRMAFTQGSVWRTGLNPANWGLAGGRAGGSALKTFTLNTQTPRWIRSTYTSANNLKFQNYLDPDYLHTVGRHARTPAWLDKLHIANPGVVSGVKTAVAAAGKGFAVLGAVAGVVNIVEGVQSGDGWQVADGIVGTITSIGSLAPPPVGLVFAGAGLAYTAGRWLFGADENGKTGIDKIGDFGKATGEVLGDVGKNVGNFVEDLWPW